MPRLKPETQLARREAILNAAEKCFARSGFHGTTMQDIFVEAGISPGALYIYFGSKEALIEGICARERAAFAQRFAAVAEAQDFFVALEALAEHYFVHEAHHKIAVMVQIGAESMRSETVARIYGETDELVSDSFTTLFRRLASEGRIAPEMEIEDAIRLVQVIGDGLLWRRAVDPHFDGRAILPSVLETIAKIIRPIPSAEVTS